MTDHFSLLPASLALVLFGVDLTVLQSGAALFLARELTGLVEFLAFWR